MAGLTSIAAAAILGTQQINLMKLAILKLAKNERELVPLERVNSLIRLFLCINLESNRH
ncbi:hypothetical protein [Mesorhizobium sp. 1B3]|uniref:hypothetical protein n=1 Tax=Mesorhizobium sp. 1B3 TaxID=3243599 RepID=UPI003D972520